MVAPGILGVENLDNGPLTGGVRAEKPDDVADLVMTPVPEQARTVASLDRQTVRALPVVARDVRADEIEPVVPGEVSQEFADRAERPASRL